jgi:hypothetical protein
MRRVWRRIAREQGLPFLQVYRAVRLGDVAPEGVHVLVNWSSGFPAELMAREDARFLHLVRDPRDVLLSGMRYHRAAPRHNEGFLHVPREDLGGRTYREHLNALPDDSARLLFEMEEKHAETVAQMLRWPWGHPRATEVRYEDLIRDEDCALFRGILRRWDVAGLDVERAVAAYWELSLFGRLSDPARRKWRTDLHVASGRPGQWQRLLPREVAEVYAARFGPALRQLGYAEGDDWVSLCRPAAALAAE